ncbi:hypothetical protein R83H12_00501 [Fibrobacteria bacterium R8-3-H12]
MRKLFSKIAFTAALGFAMAFTFSCGEHSGGGDDNPVSSSGLEISSSGGGNPAQSSSSSLTGGVVGNSSSSGGSSSSSGGERGTFTDSRLDTTYTYNWVKIGEQIWMAENLKYKAPGSKCYNNLAENCAKYGRLYNWVMAMNHCPAGWHLPSEAEWNTLTNYIGNNAGTKLKADSVWEVNARGTDNYGFAALPSGYAGSDNSFGGGGTSATWWSSTYQYNNVYKTRNIGTGDGVWGNGSSDNAKDYYSVRCVKGEPERPAVDSSSFVDTRDGISYKTVKIGVQRWMAENLKYKVTDSKCYNNDANNCKDYGRLYQWEMATNGNESNQNPSGVRGICPAGWHIPSEGEWNTLTNYIGSFAGMKLKATDGWDGYNNGLDLYGFKALPSGWVGSDNSFGGLRTSANWWSSTKQDYDTYKTRNIGTGDGVGGNGWSNANDYYSVRCVEDIEMP